MPPLLSTRAAHVVIFTVLGGGVAALDLWSKEEVFELLEVTSVGEPPRVLHQKEYVIIPGYFVLQANYNYGAFSGWFGKHTEWLTLLSAVALAVFIGILIHVLRQPTRPSWLLTVALGFLFGGTAGNLYDRYTAAAVRDWIKWFYVGADGREHIWPNFNIADSAICTGVGLLILLEIVRAVRERRARQSV